MLVKISDTVRIEDGPPRKRAVATEELLSNQATADHYQASRDATPEEIEDPSIDTKGGKRKFLDSMGKPIELGQEMDYIDWKAPPEERVWNVYQLEDVPLKSAKAKGKTTPKFMPKGTFATFEEANDFAITL